MNSKRILCTICARGGSKGVSRKNLREVAGRPLLVHTIDVAKEWGGYDDLVVSTDSDEIANVAAENGVEVPFERPDRLATDTAAKRPVLRHALREMERKTGEEYTYLVDLQVTAPLRTVEDIERCVEASQEHGVSNVFTVCEADNNPYFNMVEVDDDGTVRLCKESEEKVVRRQDAPTVYAMNGSVYVYERYFLLESEDLVTDATSVTVMPPRRSIDIDSELDLKLVEFLLEQRGQEL